MPCVLMSGSCTGLQIMFTMHFAYAACVFACRSCSSFFRNLSHFYVGSMFLMRRLHLTRYCSSSTDSPFSDNSFLMLSNHLRFGIPLLIFPGTPITITLLPTLLFFYSVFPIYAHTSTYFPALSWIFLAPWLSL